MPLFAKKNKTDFEPCPEGLWQGLCIDIVDKGMVDTQWGSKHKVQIRWVCDAEPRRADKKPYMISKSYTLSLHEKANLRQMLEVWRGRKFTEDELDGFDLEGLLGIGCQIQVAHEKGSEGATYAFPQVIMRQPKGAKQILKPADYVREQDRPGYMPPSQPQENSQVSDDDPFGGRLPENDEEDTMPF